MSEHDELIRSLRATSFTPRDARIKNQAADELVALRHRVRSLEAELAGEAELLSRSNERRYELLHEVAELRPDAAIGRAVRENPPQAWENAVKYLLALDAGSTTPSYTRQDGITWTRSNVERRESTK